jgi:hypothetical protein
MVASLHSWPWWVWEIVWSFVPAIGAVVVLIGLWMEYKSEDERRFKTINDFRSLKKKAKCGEKLVIAGVALEIVFSIGFAFKADWHTRQIEIANENAAPRNQPITRLAARVDLVLAGDVKLNPYNPDAASLFFGKGEAENRIWRVVLECKNMTAGTNVLNESVNPDVKATILVMNFGAYTFASNESLRSLGAVQSVKDWTECLINLGPAVSGDRSDILEGSVTVTANDTSFFFRLPQQTNESKTFAIPMQFLH